MTVQVVILAAGMGTRLARPHPKPLTELSDGRTIMQQQVENLTSEFRKKLRLSIVVGSVHAPSSILAILTGAAPATQVVP